MLRRGRSIALACLIAITCPLGGASAAVTSEEAPPLPTDAVVRFRGEDMFHVRSPLGRLSLAERAKAIEHRLRKAAHGSVAPVVHAVERDGSTDLLAGDDFLLSVTDADGAASGETRAQLVSDLQQDIQAALQRDTLARSPAALLRDGGYALAALAALILILLGISFAFPRVRGMVKSWEGTRVRSLRLKELELLSAARSTGFLLGALGWLRFLVIAVALSIDATILLGFFPWTRGYAAQAWTTLLAAAGTLLGAIAGYLPNLIFIGLIVVFTRLLLRFLHFLTLEIDKGNLSLAQFHREWAKPTYVVVRFLVLALAAVLMFPYLPGSGSPAFQGISVFVGVLLSLGSSSAISNVVAGIAMTYMQPFSAGDRVKIADTTGDIIGMNLLVVRIRTIKNVEVTIANSTVLSDHIVNYSAGARGKGLAIHTTVTIGYDAPWRQIHQLLIAAALGTEGVLQEPAPYVLQTSLDDFYVSYQINALTRDASAMAGIESKLHANIQDRFNEAGVEIMSSHYSSLRDGNQQTNPVESLPADYKAPSFRIEQIGDSPSTPMDETVKWAKAPWKISSTE